MAIDKLDKIGLDGVSAELTAKGIGEAALQTIQSFLQFEGDNQSVLALLNEKLANSEIGQKEIAEVQTLFNYLNSVSLNNPLQIDITLARGLNYYTGCIFEVKTDEVKIGSLGGWPLRRPHRNFWVKRTVGSRRFVWVRPNLRCLGGTATVSSIGADSMVKALFINFGGDLEQYAFKTLQAFRAKNIPAEIYPDAAKIKKQMDYANNKQIPFVVFCGETEIASGRVSVKNMETGEQHDVSIEEAMLLIG